MESSRTTGVRPWGAKVIALGVALLVGVLGLSVPTAAQATGTPPTGPYTVSGTIQFPASAPASVRQALDLDQPDATRSGVYLSLTADQADYPGWTLGEDPNVHYNPSTGAWSVTGVGNASYFLGISIWLPGGGGAQTTNDYQEFTVSGANKVAATTVVHELAALQMGIGACSTGTIAGLRVGAQNTATKATYPVNSRNAGGGGPELRCASGEGGSGVHRLEGAPAGEYLVYGKRDGVTTYLTAEGISTTDKSEAATFTLSNWSGTQAEWLTDAKRPAISGTAQVGSTLKSSVGSWASWATTSRQWKRDGVAISGATGESYTLTADDLGKRITVAATGVGAPPADPPQDPHSATMTSHATSSVVLPATAGSVSISGTVKVGHTVKVVAKGWTSGTSLTYRWKRNGASISGATKSSYKLTASDAKKKLTVTVTGKKSGYATASRTSSSKTVALGTLKTHKPAIDGTRKVGKTLKLVRGSWTSGTKFSYRWYRDGKAIKGATKSSYKLPKSSAGHRFKVKVHGVKSGYTSVSRYSSYTGKIRK